MKGTINLIFFCTYMLGLLMATVSDIAYEFLPWWGHALVIIPLTFVVYWIGVGMAERAIEKESQNEHPN